MRLGSPCEVRHPPCPAGCHPHAPFPPRPPLQWLRRGAKLLADDGYVHSAVVTAYLDGEDQQREQRLYRLLEGRSLPSFSRPLPSNTLLGWIGEYYGGAFTAAKLLGVLAIHGGLLCDGVPGGVVAHADVAGWVANPRTLPWQCIMLQPSNTRWHVKHLFPKARRNLPSIVLRLRFKRRGGYQWASLDMDVKRSAAVDAALAKLADPPPRSMCVGLALALGCWPASEGASEACHYFCRADSDGHCSGLCCNPRHIMLGTKRSNALDRMATVHAAPEELSPLRGKVRRPNQYDSNPPWSETQPSYRS